MPSTASLTLNDYDGQSGIVGLRILEVTDANLTAQATKFGVFRTATEAITLGVPIKSEISIIARFGASNEKATDENAQRGNKWRISYRDTDQWMDAPTNSIPNPGYLGVFDVEIPTANLSLRENNSDAVYTSGSGGVVQAFDDFVTAFEGLARSPYNGTPSVELIEAVTRSGG